MPDNPLVKIVRRYHQQTKHRFDAYAKGPQYLDWSAQPDPFRRYRGASSLALPLLTDAPKAEYGRLYEPQQISAKEVSLESIGALLELSLGLSAWKEFQGQRWSLRCNPSSGNLHPTEAYLVATGCDCLEPGVYHYVSYDHVLEQRCRINTEESIALTGRSGSQLLLGLSSVWWREAWKYGERAFRYCQLDIGHALAAIRYACAVLGWRLVMVTEFRDDDLESILGLDRTQDFGPAEREIPEVLLQILPNHDSPLCSIEEIQALTLACRRGHWLGTANVLDKHHQYDWPIIEEIASATRTQNTLTYARWRPGALPPPLPVDTQLTACEVIQRRRSAQQYDKTTSIDTAHFYRIADILVPRAALPPLDILPWSPKIHPLFFIHRVNGLDPGLYFLLRDEHQLASVQSVLTGQFEWRQIPDTPPHLRLYRLLVADTRKAAATLSCQQAIASDGAFSLGMLSEFDAALQSGPWNYKRLYWEAAVLGHALYLEAEALGLQGTGIGCFFDDPFHELLGIKNTRYQSVYHFTVGGALNDGRLRTLMPYTHLKRE